MLRNVAPFPPAKSLTCALCHRIADHLHICALEHTSANRAQLPSLQVAAKTDKKIATMFKTKTTWHNAVCDAKKKDRELQQKLRPLKELKQAKIKAFSKKIESEFELKNMKLLLDIKQNSGSLQKARTHYGASKTRIAKKFGFRPRSHFRRSRSRFMD